MRTPTSGASPQTLRRFPTASPDDRFVLTFWTADPSLARQADEAGVDRVGVDLERIGKEERQRGRQTWISSHTEEHLVALRPVLEQAQLFVRVNPWHTGTPHEVEAVLSAGAEVLMVPMASDPSAAGRFVELVAGRALIVLLVEDANGLHRIDELAAVAGIEEVHIGLNDLALSLGLRNRWLTLAGDLVADAGRRVLAAGLRFGFGGIGRALDVTLPVPSDLIYAEYARTGATAALLSRSFFGSGSLTSSEIGRARERLAFWRGQTTTALATAHEELGRAASQAPGW